MRGIKGSKGFNVFIGIAAGYAQNYKGKKAVVLETSHDLTAGDVQERKVFEVSTSLFKRLASP